jgi:hypothetical protein
LPHLVQALVRASRKLGPFLLGPPDEADDSCVHVPLDMARGVKRMEHGLLQYRRWLPTSSYLSFNEESAEITTTGGGVRRRHNPDGLVMTILFGAARGGVISTQARAVSYTAKPRISAQWDALALQHRDLGFGWRHWSGAVAENLTSLPSVAL